MAVPAMSGEDNDAVAAAEEKLHCASCGIAKVDDVKLTDCNSCDLVRYCSDKCEANHKSEHEEDCKKRAAELRDELLFKQPESTHFGDCPICMLPMPLDNEDYELKWCCSKLICNGCHHQCTMRELQERDLFPDCQFCREPLPHPRDFEKKLMKQLRKRVKANDPVAMYLMGGDQYAKGNYVGAFEWYTKAAGLGYMEVHYKLATMYQDGVGVEKDVEKTMHHFEEAAIGGHPGARHDLAIYEFKIDNRKRAVKHLIIAANHGYAPSMKCLMDMFKLEGSEPGQGSVSKEDLAAALRGHQAALKAAKSPQREEAAAFLRK